MKERNQDRQQEKRRKGPEPERVKIESDWEDAMKDALKKKRPKGGWPASDRGKGEK